MKIREKISKIRYNRDNEGNDIVYILDKLQRMSDFLGNESVDGELATYFLHNMDHLSHMTLQKCISDTGISKASIHRFYSRGGFESFIDFITSLSKEVQELRYQDFDDSHIIEYVLHNEFSIQQISKFAKQITKTKRVLFYGSQQEIDSLKNIMIFLRKNHVYVSTLNMWNINSAYEKIKQLDKDDMFIVVDTSLKIQNMYEISINHKNLVNLDCLKLYDFHKFYIGESNCDEFFGFYNVRIPHYRENMSQIGLQLFDKKVYQLMKERMIE